MGSGPAGGSAALFLARHGIDTVLVTKHPWLANSPRAHITNQRTMEVMRDVGLEQACYQKASPQSAMSNRIWATSLAGPEIGRIRAWGTHPSRQADYDLASPAKICDLPQNLFEPILVNEAARLGASIRLGQELVDFTQDGQVVIARVRDRRLDTEYTVQADYMIGADGARSLVAERLGLELLGRPGLRTAFSVTFHADLAHLVAHRPGSLFTCYQPGLEEWGGVGTFRMVRPWNEWLLTFSTLNADAQPDLDPERVCARVSRLIGDPAVTVRLNSVTRWMVNHLVAKDYSRGRVFCAGDAVHRHPPKNGLGSNTSIQDSYNLCWKLAMVLKGQAGAGLLDTYTVERQPVGKRVVDRAIASFGEDLVVTETIGFTPGQSPQARQAVLDALFLDTEQAAEKRAILRTIFEQKNSTVNALGMELNQQYQAGALVDDGIAEPPFERDFDLYYHPTARPGARVPHCWVEGDRALVSIHDLCGGGRFALITGLGGDGWIEAAAQVNERFGIDIRVSQIGPRLPLRDVYGDWAQLSGVRESGCVLVRPDLHVGWRATHWQSQSAQQLAAVFGQILSRPSQDL